MVMSGLYLCDLSFVSLTPDRVQNYVAHEAGNTETLFTSDGPPALGYRTHMYSSLGQDWIASEPSFAPLGRGWFSFLAAAAPHPHPQPPTALPSPVLSPRGFITLRSLLGPMKR